MDERNVEPPVEQVLAALEAERPRFRPAVGPAKPRVRPGLIVLLLCTMTAGAVTFALRGHDEPTPPTEAPASWWSDAGAQCTPLGAHTAIRNPAWSPVQRVACLAIAGKIDEARTRIQGLSAASRFEALQLIFEIAHPIADSGDDQSAGPIMGLVSELWPTNYMAVFHAGMAQFALGNDAAAKEHLEHFLATYLRDDVWTARAKQALRDIEAHVPTSQRQAHFPE
jgi:hypothetical protein